jgi:hypothetical protein
VNNSTFARRGLKESSFSEEALAKAGPDADCDNSIVRCCCEVPQGLLVLSLDEALLVDASHEADWLWQRIFETH